MEDEKLSQLTVEEGLRQEIQQKSTLLRRAAELLSIVHQECFNQIEWDEQAKQWLKDAGMGEK